MVNIRRAWGAFWRDQAGVSAVEYATLLAFVGAGIMLASGDLGSAVSAVMERAAFCIDGSVTPTSC